MTIKYRDVRHYKYQLVDDYQIRTSILDKNIKQPKKHPYIFLDPLGVLTIRSGYQWDGPSGPTVDTKNFMRGSLVHDALYQLMRSGDLDLKYRKYADELLRDICVEDGMSKIRAWWVFHGVDLLGKSSAKKGGNYDTKIYTAP